MEFENNDTSNFLKVQFWLQYKGVQRIVFQWLTFSYKMWLNGCYHIFDLVHAEETVSGFSKWLTACGNFV